MDLRLYGRVLWRFRVIVSIGVLLALSFALLTIVRVSFAGGRPSFSYRQPEVWQSTATIFVTQPGFPLGRSVYTKVVPIPQASGTTSYIPVQGDPNRFASWATLYANLAMSDDVKRFMLERGGAPGTITATAEQMANVGTPLPLIQLSGLATSPGAAVTTARQGTNSLVAFVKRQQDAQRVPADQRVLLQVLNQPRTAAIASSRSKTRPVVVFLAAMLAVLGLVFVLENLRPRLRPVRDEADTPDRVTTRRSA